MKLPSTFTCAGIGCLLLFSRLAYPASDAFTVTDALGCAVAFAHEPKRVALAGKASFMMAHAACLFPEARHRIVPVYGGMSSRVGAGDFLAQILPEPLSAEPPGTEVGAEQILALQPDGVLLKAAARRLGDSLARTGLPIVYFDFETPEQYGRDLAVMGRLFNNETRAKGLTDYYENLRQSVSSRTARLPIDAKPRVLLIQFSERAGVIAFRVPAPEWIQTEMVETAGGVPVWKETAQRGGWTMINFEQIAVWDPDLVLVVDYRTCANQAVAAIQDDDRWQRLHAVRNNKVYAFPGDFVSWDQPDPRWGLGLLWVATRIHPQEFSDIDLPQEVERFYSFYDLDRSTIRSTVFPLIQENIGHVSP